MRELLESWRGSPVVLALGGGLFLTHLAHAVAEGESLRTFVFGILLPMFVSAGVVLGGVWLWRSGFDAVDTRRVAAWCVVGVVVLALGAVLTIRYQQAHGVRMEDRAFVVLESATFGALIGFIVGLYDAQRHRQQRTIRTREAALDDLHAATRELVRTSDRQVVAARAVRAARDVLGLSMNGCWLYDEAEDALIPVASTDEATDLLGELPTYTGEGSLSWEAFETGEVMLFDDVRNDPDRYRTDTPIRSEMILPLGEYGVMNVGSTDAGAFDEMDVSLVRILAANARTALERTEREQQLAAARDEAEHLNRQLTVLNRVFRHDLRNAANVIQGHAELLADDSDGETVGASADTIREQAAELVATGEQVREVERLLRDDEHERTPVDIVEVVDSRLDRVRRDHPAVEATGPEREGCHVYAHPLVESAVQNVITNAVEHNDGPTPRVDVTVSRADDGYVDVRIADDGPGIPDDEVSVLERGYETPLEHTSGLGLWLVNWIVRESDGEVYFDENDPQGSVVGLRFEAAPADASMQDDAVRH